MATCGTGGPGLHPALALRTWLHLPLDAVGRGAVAGPAGADRTISGIDVAALRRAVLAQPLLVEAEAAVAAAPPARTADVSGTATRGRATPSRTATR